jgi:hypothetical protein
VFVIKREDGKYVAAFGSDHSYTTRLQQAQTFSTRAVADSHACSNEYVVDERNEFARQPLCA